MCEKYERVQLDGDSGEEMFLRQPLRISNTHKYLHVSQMAGEESQDNFICHISDEREHHLKVFIEKWLRLREQKNLSCSCSKSRIKLETASLYVDQHTSVLR